MNIRETIEATITANINEDALTTYGPAITTVAEALQEREYAITEAIIEAATEQYSVNEGEVTSILEAAGLTLRPAPPIVEEPAFAEETDDLVARFAEEDRFTRLEQTVDKLATTVANLAALAARHLGADL